MLTHAPSVQMQSIPDDAIDEDSDEEDKVDKDERLPQYHKDKYIVPDNEYSDSEDEGEGGRRDNRSFKGYGKRLRMMEETGKAENIKAENEKNSGKCTGYSFYFKQIQ